MPTERLKPALFFDEERLAALKNLAPEAFVDGKINWSTLKDALGGELEESEEEDEHFGLSWPGKRESRKLAGKPSTGTLVPAKGEGINEETTNNIFIEGENLEVLKLLRKSYSGRVKMIYIDPPYNTGNDFVYDDDFAEPLQDYLKRTGQIDGEGKPTTTNKKADGRFHSKWLSMMYPRLRLARELLRDDGVIFVSIDDNEVHHLRMLMNEVFGEENFVGIFTWKSRTAKADVPNGVSSDSEWILTFSKTDQFVAGRAGSRKYYKTSDFDSRWRLQDLTTNKTKAERPNSFFDMINPKTGIIFESNSLRTWSVTKDTFPDYYTKGKIVFPGDYDFLKIKRPAFRVFEIEDIEKAIEKYGSDEIRMSVSTTLPVETVGRTENGTEEIRSIFNNQIFNFPKPSTLVKYIQTISMGSDDIILDFFSGSATTAHAILDLNKEDGGKRQFILVQMPEATPTDSEAAKAGYKTIAEIGKERIRRVIKKIEAEGAGELDLGFKVFKLAKSHYKPWENYHGESVEKIEELFAEYVTPLVSGWRQIENGLLTEILLLEGFPLDSTITPVAVYPDNTVVEVSSGFHEHRLVVCLDDRIEAATVASLKLRENDHFVVTVS